MEPLSPPRDSIDIQREAFFARLDEHFDPNGIEHIRNAHRIAAHLHRDAEYGGGLYEVHLLDVANNVLSILFPRDEYNEYRDDPQSHSHDERYWHAVAGALLHDAVENHEEELVFEASVYTHVTDPYEALGVLLDSPRVPEIVRKVTNIPLTEEQKATYTRAQKLDHYVNGLTAKLFAEDTTWESIVVKVADNLANVRRIGNKDWLGKVLYRTDRYWRLPDIFDFLIEERLQAMDELSLPQLGEVAGAVDEIRTRLQWAMSRIQGVVLEDHIARVTGENNKS